MSKPTRMSSSAGALLLRGAPCWLLAASLAPCTISRQSLVPKPPPAACAPPEMPLAGNAPNTMMIGDSISEGPSGYSLFVRDLLLADYFANASSRGQAVPGSTKAAGASFFGTVQHGGGEGGRGQMASSDNGVAKVRDCIGNATGNLSSKAWSVVTYNAGLHDCDRASGEYVSPAAYRANLEGVFSTLLPAAHAVIFVTTTPLPSPSDHSITMSCIRQYNRIAREVAAEAAGPVFLADLWGDVERFCDVDGDAFNISQDANFTRCALMCTGPRACGRMGMHFMDAAPWPSGQQFTALSVANAIIRRLPESSLPVRKTPFLEPFYIAKNDQFTKTGSGQTCEMLRKEWRFLQPPLVCVPSGSPPICPPRCGKPCTKHPSRCCAIATPNTGMDWPLGEEDATGAATGSDEPQARHRISMGQPAPAATLCLSRACLGKMIVLV